MSFLRSDFVRRCLLRGYLNKNRINTRLTSSKSVTENTTTSAQTPIDSLKVVVHPTDFQKRMMVWVGRYKTVHEIPDVVPYETYDKVRNKFRIKICNYMIVITLLCCIGLSISGRKAAESGDSVMKMNLDWHKDYNDAAKAVEEAKAKK